VVSSDGTEAGLVDSDGNPSDAKEAVMSANAHRPQDTQLTDLIEDAAFLGMLFSGAAIAVVIVLLLILF
jgi:hypothetical protein